MIIISLIGVLVALLTIHIILRKFIIIMTEDEHKKHFAVTSINSGKQEEFVLFPNQERSSFPLASGEPTPTNKKSSQLLQFV
ncbi:unnamed protein product [Didymodactylos carnosus]|uniref:Uncharacterized protein n=1 Tax=Didymodactylos carnosus TaxID=1234261 RepID=A0A8S2HNV9_9BILA|nr:unnamed protein product [Didymodactylos carnosus]CAF3665326.1 unnamed protein product [Didymodactylos carnosus]